MSSEKKLSLKILVHSNVIDVNLEPGGSLKLGRGQYCDIQVDESSVSTEHLKITYDERGVKVEDLGSTNGTFRLPSEAPFVEAFFVTNEQSLSLKLGFETKIEISWKFSNVEAVGDTTKTSLEIAGMMGPEVVASKQKPLPTASLSPQVLDRPQGIATQKSPTATKQSLRHQFGHRKLFGLLVFSALIFIGTKFLWLRDLEFAEQALPQHKGVGLGIDILAVSLSGYALRGWLISAVCLLLGYVFFKFWIKPLYNKKIRLAVALWALMVSLWPLVYPFVLSARNGVGVVHFNALKNSQRIFNSSQFTLEEKSQKFSELLPHLKGSSYFYAKVMNLFFEKVVDECGGAWKDDWDKKKLCLILINSVAMESMIEIKPLILAPVAARVVLLTSLDSILRVFPVEGADSEMNEIFIKSLQNISLDQEAKRIHDILKSTDTSSEKKVEQLQKLKIVVELRLNSLQNELKIPKMMAVSIPDILVLGI